MTKITLEFNGRLMEAERFTDKKTIKAFRRIERMLDEAELRGQDAVGLLNADTGREFGILLTLDRWNDIVHQAIKTSNELEEVLEIIATLEDDNALLGIIDAQNDVLQGRVTVDEATAPGLSDKEVIATHKLYIPALHNHSATRAQFTDEDVKDWKDLTFYSDDRMLYSNESGYTCMFTIPESARRVGNGWYIADANNANSSVPKSITHRSSGPSEAEDVRFQTYSRSMKPDEYQELLTLRARILAIEEVLRNQVLDAKITINSARAILGELVVPGGDILVNFRD